MSEVDEDVRWQESGLCRQVDAEIWFPELGASALPAKRICMGCEVRETCLAEALANNERFGVWGGASERERSRMRRGEKVTLRSFDSKDLRPCKVCDTPVTHHAAALYCSQQCAKHAEYQRRNASRREARSVA